MSDLNELSKKIVSRRDAMKKAGVALLGLGIAGIVKPKVAIACCEPGTCGLTCHYTCWGDCNSVCGDQCSSGCGPDCSNNCYGSCTMTCQGLGTN